jgi:O-antigen/teichoic acid export membrane protein
LPISIGTVLVAPELVIFLFGQPFADAAPILRVLICAALPLFWVNIASHALNAADCVWGLVGVYGVGAAINIGGNLLLIPLWGALGASLATLVCEWLTLGLVVRLLDSALGLSLTGEGLWRYAAATAALAVAVWSTRMFGLGTEITAGSLAYVGALWITGYTRSPDAVSIKRLLTQ